MTNFLIALWGSLLLVALFIMVLNSDFSKGVQGSPLAAYLVRYSTQV